MLSIKNSLCNSMQLQLSSEYTLEIIKSCVVLLSLEHPQLVVRIYIATSHVPKYLSGKLSKYFVGCDSVYGADTDDIYELYLQAIHKPMLQIPMCLKFTMI